MTRRRTSKSRKKKEKKLYSLKEGSRFEDVALLHALKSAIVAVDNMSGKNGVPNATRELAVKCIATETVKVRSAGAPEGLHTFSN